MNDLPVRRDPAPHRGFNSKAREVLLDSTKVTVMRRSGSDEEFLRRVGLIRFRRGDSDETESQKSGASSPGKGFKKASEDHPEDEEFDGIDDLPKLEKKLNKMKCRTLEEIGRTRSVGELSKKRSSGNSFKLGTNKTFKQMNIVKLPSAESEQPLVEKTAKISALFDTCPLPLASIEPKRTAQYEMQ